MVVTFFFLSGGALLCTVGLRWKNGTVVWRWRNYADLLGSAKDHQDGRHLGLIMALCKLCGPSEIFSGKLLNKGEVDCISAGHNDAGQGAA